MSKSLIAIVGRPNVGKSTLFNRIVGHRMAVVESEPGITRDRIYAEAEWTGREFVVVDTGGILMNDVDPLKTEVTAQARAALEEADVVLLMVDATTGITPADLDVAESLRGHAKPILIVANKADNENLERDSAEFYELGLGEVFPISALNGRSVADLLDRVVEMMPASDKAAEYPQAAARIAIVGRPNVGKSSLLNAIVGSKRAIVSDIPGTTRDAVDTVVERDGQQIVLVDTAGIRRAGKVQGSVEYYTVLRAIRALERADVAMIVIDAAEGLLDGDKRVAGFAHEAGRAVVVVVNKWDLVNERSMREFADEVKRQTPYLSYAPVVFTSAKTGSGVAAALDTAMDAAANHALRLPTADLTRLVLEAADRRPYSRKGRDLKVKYATMPAVAPPTIVIFVNDPSLVHFSYARYLENQIRREYSYEGTPLKLEFRKTQKRRE